MILPTIPDAPRFMLRCVRLVDAPGLFDITIADGRIERLVPHGPAPADILDCDLAGRMVWPGFVDVHTHLDKGHIWPRAANPDGSFLAARRTVAADRQAHWSVEDVVRRFEFGLRCAYAHGTVAIRTHLDSLAPQHRISWPLFAELRHAWHDRIALQASSLVPLDALDDPVFANELARIVAAVHGSLGAVVLPMPDLARRVADLLHLAAEYGLDVDMHVDESLDDGAHSLPIIAGAALAQGFRGRILVGHCCSLTMQPADEVARTLALMARAGMSVVSLPMCNMYLQDRRPGRTPRRRGVTLLHEMRAVGIDVALASDNCRDPFYAYGDHDMLEVFREAVRIAQLDHPLDGWCRAVTDSPAWMMGMSHGRIAEGVVADLAIFQARSMSELLARPQSDRIVLRAGRAIDTTLPDYAELDDLVGMTQ